MQAIRSQIYILTDKLRRMYDWGLEHTERFREMKTELIELQEKLDKAEELLEKYFQDIRKRPYWG